MPLCNFIGCSTLLELAQKFRLATPDSSLRELGGAWARDSNTTLSMSCLCAVQLIWNFVHGKGHHRLCLQLDSHNKQQNLLQAADINEYLAFMCFITGLVTTRAQRAEILASVFRDATTYIHINRETALIHPHIYKSPKRFPNENKRM